MSIWLALGGLIITILVGIAVYYHWQLHKQALREKELELSRKEKEQEKSDYLNSSIQILAKGLLAEEMTITEGSIRISVLLSYFPNGDDYKDEFPAFYQVASKTAHIPILEDWKKLSLKQRMAFDSERLVVEEEYQDFVLDAAKRLVGRVFS